MLSLLWRVDKHLSALVETNISSDYSLLSSSFLVKMYRLFAELNFFGYVKDIPDADVSSKLLSREIFDLAVMPALYPEYYTEGSSVDTAMCCIPNVTFEDTHPEKTILLQQLGHELFCKYVRGISKRWTSQDYIYLFRCLFMEYFFETTHDISRVKFVNGNTVGVFNNGWPCYFFKIHTDQVKYIRITRHTVDEVNYSWTITRMDSARIPERIISGFIYSNLNALFLVKMYRLFAQLKYFGYDEKINDVDVSSKLLSLEIFDLAVMPALYPEYYTYYTVGCGVNIRMCCIPFVTFDDGHTEATILLQKPKQEIFSNVERGVSKPWDRNDFALLFVYLFESYFFDIDSSISDVDFVHGVHCGVTNDSCQCIFFRIKKTPLIYIRSTAYIIGDTTDYTTSWTLKKMDMGEIPPEIFKRFN
jgi:hypothetical protein